MRLSTPGVELGARHNFSMFIIFRTWQFFDSSSSTLGGDRHVRLLTFFVGNVIPNNFYLKQFFVLIGNIGSIQS